MRQTQWVMGMGISVLCLVFAGFPQPVAHAVTDTSAPTGTIVINANRSTTNTPNVTLALTWDDGPGGSGVSRVRFSNDGAIWSAWEAPAASKAYTLSGTDGYKTVRAQFLDKANNRSAVYNDYIRLDTTPPTGGIGINNGDATTTSRAVTLNLNWADTGSGVTRMRFSDNGSTWTAWESPKATRAHTLPAGLGNHTVRVQYTDAAGNYSLVYKDYIKLVEPAPGTEATVLLPGDVPLTMVWVPGGNFMMGAYPGEHGTYSYEIPQHAVAVDGFWMAKYELTKRQWFAVMGTTPWLDFGLTGVLTDLDSPAVYVSWNLAQSFLTAVNSSAGTALRLPSEAQWEYACRAGNQVPPTRFYWGDDLNYAFVGDYAWYFENASNVPDERYAHVVGLKLPNAFGLYDMIGNVEELCEDDLHDDYTGAPTGAQAWVDSPRGTNRVTRGASWVNSDNFLRSAHRNARIPTESNSSTGMRLVQPL